MGSDDRPILRSRFGLCRLRLGVAMVGTTHSRIETAFAFPGWLKNSIRLESNHGCGLGAFVQGFTRNRDVKQP